MPTSSPVISTAVGLLYPIRSRQVHLAKSQQQVSRAKSCSWLDRNQSPAAKRQDTIQVKEKSGRVDKAASMKLCRTVVR